MRTRNYWIYFLASLVSLIGSNYFIFTQGWYLLKLTGRSVSVGTTWTLFFLPSLLFLPLIGRMLDSRRLKRVILSFEIAKVALLAAFIPLLARHPSSWLVYLLAALFGIAFAPYHPSVYVIVKRLVPAERQTRYSHLFEVSLQLANIAAAFSSGYVFEAFGFTRLLAASLALILLGLVGMSRMRLEDGSGDELRFDAASIRGAYRELGAVLSKIASGSPSEEGISRRQLAFGAIHQLPHAVIMVSNVPLILYVHELMKAGAREFGILDAAFGIAALGASLLWARWHELSQRTGALIAAGGVASLAVTWMGAVSPEGVWPYVWTVVYGSLLISSKILARGTVVRLIPREKIGRYSTAFQAVGYAMMMTLFAAISVLSNYLGAQALFVVLGGVLAAYALGVFLLLGDGIKMILQFAPRVDYSVIK